MRQIRIDIKDFGGTGDGVTCNYLAFREAAFYASQHPNTSIYFDGIYFIEKYRTIKNDPINHIVWKNCKGLKLIGKVGTVISMNGNFFRPLDYTTETGAKKSYTGGLSPFWFFHCENLEVRNIEVNGNVQDTTRAEGVDVNNPSVTESENILLRFTKCENVTVNNMTLHHAECDGITISGDRVETVWINSGNFIFEKVKSFNNGRQGMSIGGLSGGYFKNCSFSNNGFTGGDYGHNDPAAGNDNEPGPFHYLNDLLFEGCKFENNYGSNFICSYPETTTDVTLLNCRITTNIKTPKPQGITILAKNALIEGCIIKLGERTIRISNPLHPGASTKINNCIVESSGNCINTTIEDRTACIIISNNKFRYRGSAMTANFLSLQSLNLQFINNKVFIPAAAVKSRPTGTHTLVQNAAVSKGNRFYTDDKTVKIKVDYSGTLEVADIK